MANERPVNVSGPFPVARAAELSHLSVDMVNYLCRYGIAKPTGSKKRGRGHIRLFTFKDILLLRVIAKLLENGVSVSNLKKAISKLHSRGNTAEEILTKRFLVTDGKDVYLQDKGVLELLATGQLTFAFVMELNLVRKQLSYDITRQMRA